METVKTDRKQEATREAEIQGAKTIIFDVGDYPMRIQDAILYELASLYGRFVRNLFSHTHSRIRTILIIRSRLMSHRRRASWLKRMDMNLVRQ
jgi:hypothetical protein